MKQFAFLTVLAFLAVSLFAQTASDYDKILKGDFSAVAGYYVTEDNWRIFLPPDGNTAFNDYRVSDFRKTGGVYTWGILGRQEGVAVMLFPIGVDIEGITTDTTKVRIYFTSFRWEAPSNPSHIYYKESKFPATHVTTDNLRLRMRQDLNSETITILEKGAKALVQYWRDPVTIDGISGRWVQVYTIDGLMGYCFSGYLEELSDPVSAAPQIEISTWDLRIQWGEDKTWSAILVIEKVSSNAFGNTFEGYFEWYLSGALVGREIFSGMYTSSSKEVNMQGIKVENMNTFGVRLGMDKYRAFLSNDGNSLTRGTVPDGTWEAIKRTSQPHQVSEKDLVGIWRGSYNAPQGETGMLVTVYEEGGKYMATWDYFNLPGKSNAATGKFLMSVSYNQASQQFYLKAVEYIIQPSGYGWADLEGTITENVFSGFLAGSNWSFRTVRQ
jgi:hypothetical protein